MTLFFPSSTNNVKINASNSQVGVTVGDTMSITAGDTFTIAGGSTASIKIGPATSFSIGSAVNISLASTLSYTYGFTASYGAATTAMSTTSTAKATDSYTIQAGVFTSVTQKLILAEKYQIFGVLLATVISMGAIAIAVVGGLSSPMFITDPSNTSATIDNSDPSKPVIVPGTTNPNAVENSPGNVARAACAMAITTVTVFIGQWALTYLLAKSSAFSPVTSMVFNSTGITTSAYTLDSYTANSEAIIAKTATTPSVVSTLYTPSATSVEVPSITHQVNDTALPGPIPLSPQLSEVVITPTTINLNTTTQPSGVLAAATVNTQIVMSSKDSKISLYSNSVATSNTGNMTIAADTAITNPAGTITLSSGTGTVSGLTLDQATSATLASGNGSVVVKSSEVNIGVATAGNAVFNSEGVTLGGTTINIAGTNITIGGALTIVGGAGELNAALAAVPQQAIKNTATQEKLTLALQAANLEIKRLQEQMSISQTEARLASKALQTLEDKMGQIIKVKSD